MANGGPVCGPISTFSRVRILHALFEGGSAQDDGTRTRAAVSYTHLTLPTKRIV